MMDSLITQCPACGTSFKLTKIQLDAAGGAVRCGACLEVFAAGEYMLEPPLDDMELESEAFAEADVDAQSVTRETGSGSIESSDIAPSDSPGDHTEDDEFLEDGANPKDFQIGTNIIYHLAEYAVSTESVTDSSHQALPDNFEIETDVEPLDEVARNSLHETIGNELPEIVETISTGKNVLKLTLFACANLILMVVLSGQFLWFNRGSLAVREDMRAYYLDVCAYAEKIVECNLPDYVSLKQITTRRLIVRSHPKINNALVIDAIILNSGIFAQPFPGLELKFTDIESNIVASRRFDSSEYLGGELTGLEYMPGGTEVRLALEIVDPGEAAISYELYAVRN